MIASSLHPVSASSSSSSSGSRLDMDDPMATDGVTAVDEGGQKELWGFGIRCCDLLELHVGGKQSLTAD
jgi:hypothetical protein